MASSQFSSIIPGCTIPVPIPALTQFTTPVPVIGPQFCSHLTTELNIVEGFFHISKGNYVVKDIQQNIIFKVEGKFFSLHAHRVVRNTAGVPIMTLRRKIVNPYKKWKVFRGDSHKPSDLAFSVKRSAVIPLKTKLHVFLANNAREEVCDYKIEGSWTDRSCKIYAGDTVVAKMEENRTTRSFFGGKDNFLVTIYPNVDYALIVALILIFAEVSVEIIPMIVSTIKTAGVVTKLASTFS